MRGKLCRLLLILTSALILAGCNASAPKNELVMFCAAGLKVPVSRIVAEFEKETGIAVRLQFAGSGTLLGNLRIAPGDLYLAADASYIEEAERYQLLSESFVVAKMKAGLGVASGNPKQLTSLADLQNSESRVGVGNPEAASIGRFTKRILESEKVWRQLDPAAMFPTVNELANAIKLGTIDGAIIWDAVAEQYPEVDFIELDEFAREEVSVTVAITSSCSDKGLAREFCQYLSGAEQGRQILEQEGFTTEQLNHGKSS